MADGIDNAVGGRSRKGWWYLLLIIPFIATLWVPFYNSLDPKLAGIPFFAS
jgi:hypothetical protein